MGHFKKLTKDSRVFIALAVCFAFGFSTLEAAAQEPIPLLPKVVDAKPAKPHPNLMPINRRAGSKNLQRPPRPYYIASPMARHHQPPTLTYDPLGINSIYAELESAEKKFPSKQIVFEVRFLTIPEDRVDSVYESIDRSKMCIGTAQLPSIEAESLPSIVMDTHPMSTGGVISSTTVVQNRPTVTALITEKQVLQLVKMTKLDPHSTVKQAPTLTVFDNQSANINDLSLRPFVVGIAPVTDGQKTAHQPVIQTVEDGQIIRLHGGIRGKLIFIEMDFTQSQILGVDLFEIPGSAERPRTTIQMPRQKVIQTRAWGLLSSGDAMLVDFMTTASPSSRKTTMQKIPLVKQTAWAQPEMVKQRIFAIVRATVIEQ